MLIKVILLLTMIHERRMTSKLKDKLNRFKRSSKIKALLGMLVRLPWGRRDMSRSLNGEHRAVC